MESTPEPTPVVLADPAFWAGSGQDHAFATLRHSAPVSWQPEPPTAWNPAGGRGYWSVTTHRLVSEVSRKGDVFGSRHGTEIQEQDPEMLAGAGMLNMDAPEHTRLRSIVSRVFTRQRVAALRAHIDARCAAMVDQLVQMGEFDFVAEAGDVYPAGIIGELMEVDPADLPMLVALTSRILGPDVDSARSANREMIAYGMGLGEQKLRSPGDDLVSLIVHADPEGQHLSIEEVGIFFALLLTAGIETTGTSLNHAVVALDEHRDQRRRWLEDPTGLAPTAIEEIFRWSTPVRRFRRTALVDTELDGTAIAAGDKVVLWYCSANRDEKVFDRADQFDIGRSPNPHLAFGGGGHHFCLGANLARAEVEAFMTAFLRRMPDYSVAGDVVHASSDAFNVLASVPCVAGPLP
jgi:cytochrome P450